jgi:hypothetical protein
VIKGESSTDAADCGGGIMDGSEGWSSLRDVVGVEELEIWVVRNSGSRSAQEITNRNRSTWWKRLTIAVPRHFFPFALRTQTEGATTVTGGL